MEIPERKNCQVPWQPSQQFDWDLCLMVPAIVDKELVKKGATATTR